MKKKRTNLPTKSRVEADIDSRRVRVAEAGLADDPFAAFSEWLSEADEAAYKNL